ncbi:MAG TPA: outer membrane beta-barrel protein [Candidatus Sulfotelmatobacter sp.]|nr:outer membrane beta-barrel protein [Candidatus Sulfotelmatobacter sp.]
MRNAAIVAFTLILFAGLANAQVPTSGNIFVGYSFYSASSSSLGLSDVGRPKLNGWNASLEGKMLPWVGIVADFSGHYGSQSFLAPSGAGGGTAATVSGHETDVMFGPRLSFSIRKFRPFGEAMFGVGHISTGQGFSLSDTSFITAVGGGLDYKIIRILALRGEADYVQTHFFSTTQDDFRLSTGVVVRF